jgi:hypothetical protein
MTLEQWDTVAHFYGNGTVRLVEQTYSGRFFIVLDGRFHAPLPAGNDRLRAFAKFSRICKQKMNGK